jgi:hypothetical protein
MLKGNLGAIEHLGLAWLGDSSVETMEANGKKTGDAKYSMNVEGQNGKCKVKMTLRLESDVWQVKTAIIEEGTGAGTQLR